VMLVADVIRGLVTGLLAALALTTIPSLTWLGPIAVVLGCASGAFIPAEYTVLPAVLSTDQVGRGFALATAANQLAGVGGPALAGALVAVFGPGLALAFDAASFMISASTLLAVRSRIAASRAAERAEEDGATTKQPESPRPSIILLLRRGRLLQVILIVAVVCNLVYSGTMEVALPAFAHEHYQAYGYGILMTLLSIGTLAGTALASKYSEVKAVPYLLSILACVMGISLGLLPYLGGFVGAGIAIAIYGLATGWQNIVAGVLLQTWTPEHLLGRTMSLVMLGVQGSFPISVAIAGLAVNHVGPAPLFPIAGAAIAVAVVGALANPTYRRFRMGDKFTLPATRPSFQVTE
jgi:MFS family permease